MPSGTPGVWKLIERMAAHPPHRSGQREAGASSLHHLRYVTVATQGFLCGLKFKNLLTELIEHLNEAQDASYLTLSHCWGKPPHSESHLTKLATLSARIHAIPFLGLPRTFQDAIIIARYLEIPYIWIDTFCIIQDSRSDWEQEAASMAKVYSESLCTIAASSSDNWSGGCFVPRDAAKTISCNSYWPRAEDGLGTGDVSLTIFPPLPTENLKNCVLNQRAWTLQESQLSRRVLHYTDIQIIWECRSLGASESDPEGGPSIQFPGYTVIASNRTPYDEWRERIKEYSGRKLTRWTDRLPGLSGLASQTRVASVSDEYLAGLWRRDLIKGLLWYRGSWVEPLWKYHEFLAPTWSWASVIGPVQMHVFRNIFDMDLVDETSSPSIHVAGVTLAGLDPFGQVIEGLIRLSGFIRKAVSRRGDKDPLGSVYAFPLFDEGGTVPRGNFTPDCSAEPGKEPLYCLRMCTTTWPDYKKGQFLVLVLRPTGRVDDEFERHGAGEIIDTRWFNGCDERVITVI